MGARMRHRGPDDAGVWTDTDGLVALSHQRLSIVDLTAAGRQPMQSACGRYVISYNGEIYNAAALKPELEAQGYVFRGHSDTEVLLNACVAWGVKRALQRMIGMFAFALWDLQARVLYLARDRLGIKPLYWSLGQQGLIFSSELRACSALPHWKPELSPQAIAAYLHHGYIPAPLTIIKGFFKLAPGGLLTLGADMQPHLDTFWKLEDAVERGRMRPFSSEGEAVEAGECLITDAVKQCMVSDVRIGAFLSGGIDSSLVAATMQRISSQPVKTFTIGFSQAAYDEAPYARRIADHIGSEHFELYVDEASLLDLVPNLQNLYDEPVSDSSAIPTVLLSALTRQHVTVALSGDGGDELFCGYTRYQWAARIEMWRKLVPPVARKALGTLALSLPSNFYDKVSSLFGHEYAPIVTGYRIHKLATAMQARNSSDLYDVLASQWYDLAPFGSLAQSKYGRQDRIPHFDQPEEEMQYKDTLSYLPDDLLFKVDRASMAKGLEVRVPLLDHRLVEYSWRLPFSLKHDGVAGKKILRQVLGKYMPSALFERPKLGFGVPLDIWLRGHLLKWATALVEETDWEQFGISTGVVRTLWRSFLASHTQSAYRIWILLSLAAWWNGFKPHQGPALPAPLGDGRVL